MARRRGKADVLDIGWFPFGQAILHAYEKYAADPSRALRHADLDPDRLPMHGGRISMVQYLALADYAMRELDDEALGWFSRRLPLGIHGMLVRGSFSAPSLHVALKRRIRHHNLVIEDVKLGLAVNEGVVTLHLDEAGKIWAWDSFRHVCLFALLVGIFGSACWAVDSRIAPLGMTLPFAPPPGDDEYAELIGCPVRYHQPVASLSFDSRYLKLPILRGEEGMRAMLRHPLELTMFRYRRDRILVKRVRDLLLRGGDANMTAVVMADVLNVSVRTLHRQLREEGTTLQGLKDEIRFSRAEHLLTHTTQSLKQIAAQIGFINEKSFFRAFRHRTGQSPAAFRRTTGGDGPAEPG